MFGCSVKKTFLNVADITYGMLCVTKIVLKINYSNPPVLAENLPFLENISDLLFSLNILLVFQKLFLAKER